MLFLVGGVLRHYFTSTPMNDVTALTLKSRWADRIERSLGSGSGWIVVVSLLLAFILRLNSALGTYLNPDEALHYVLVNQSSLAGAYQASLTNAHPPLYFVLLYYWHFVGNSEVMLRLPSVLAGTAVGWMAFRWVAMVLGRTAGIIMRLLLAFSPVLTALAAEVRDYSLLLLWMASALYFMEKAFRDQRVSSIAYYSFFLYLAILTHYSAVWFVLAAGIYVVLRISSLKGHPRISWMLFQVGAAAIYVWLFLVHVSRMRGSPMEAEAMTGWLRALYFHAGESPMDFLQRTTLDAFQYLFGSRVGGGVALAAFCAGVLWLLSAGLFRKRRDLAAFGLLLLLPFVFGMIASLLDFYPYGGTRHCIYLLIFATAGVSYLIATVVRERLLPILLVAPVLVPYWYLHRLPDPQQMGRKEQMKGLMTNAIVDLKTSVQPAEPVFTDYQASVLLAYYLGRDHPPPAPRECGGVTEVQYGAYHFVVVSGWSATATQLMSGIDGWRKACNSVPGDSLWIFDAGWGMNLLDDVSSSAPRSISQAQKFGETISLFKLRIDR
jgi:4-amino-4-deoxy-L-arabinose transferase-like glycosyltransferase